MTQAKQPKLLAISSPGGHWIQLTRLCAGLSARYQISYAMPDKLFKAAGGFQQQKLYPIMDVSADDRLRLIPCSLQILYILLKERPDAVLSTGAAPGAIAIWIASLLGIRTIWVDSIANVKQISRAGRLAKKRADVFLTQWEHLSNGKDILFKGAVL